MPLTFPRGALAAVAALALAQLAVAPSARAEEPAPPAGGPDEDAIHVIVGPGARSLTPMAIADARCFGAPADACRQVDQALRRDMLLSFFFEVLPSRSYLADPNKESLSTILWSDWGNVGARYLIKAEIKGPAPYQAEFRLYNIAQQKVIDVRGQSARVTTQSDLVGAAHNFANGVLEAITGVPGVFGSKIAYHYVGAPGTKGIGVINMDGSGRGGLVGNDNINMLPVWGLGGVLYTSFRSGKPNLWLGGRRFSKDEGHYRKVAVSPDGSKLIASISYGDQSDLYLLSPDGAVLKNLTNSGADEVSPTFSPDGSSVAFVSSAAGGPQIFMMSAGGGGQTRLTHAGSYNYAPDWGKSGLIAFAGMEEGVSDLFTVDQGGNITRLTQDQGSNKDPSWSPDGRYIAFVSTREGATGFWLMSADGRYQYRIAKAGGVGSLAWRR